MKDKSRIIKNDEELYQKASIGRLMEELSIVYEKKPRRLNNA